MAVEYERYRQSSAAEQSTIVAEATGRLHGHLQIGPLFVDTKGLFDDVYLLFRAGYLDINPEDTSAVRRLAAHPKVRGDFVKRLKEQDTANQNKEVLATLTVGNIFGYHAEVPFVAVFSKLEAKHVHLIAEEERQKTEEAARKTAEATARRSAKRAWASPESNTGKSPEWVAAQEKIAQLWEQRNRTLPQGINRETEDADAVYFHAGFNLLKEEILGGPLSNLQLRAMIEYLIPKIGRTPRTFEGFFKRMQKETNSSTNLSNLGTLAKGFFIPLVLQRLTTPPDAEQKKQITALFRSFQKAMHPDIPMPDVNKDLNEYVVVVNKAVNISWPPVNKLIR